MDVSFGPFGAFLFVFALVCVCFTPLWYLNSVALMRFAKSPSGRLFGLRPVSEHFKAKFIILVIFAFTLLTTVLFIFEYETGALELVSPAAMCTLMAVSIMTLLFFSAWMMLALWIAAKSVVFMKRLPALLLIVAIVLVVPTILGFVLVEQHIFVCA